MRKYNYKEIKGLKGLGGYIIGNISDEYVTYFSIPKVDYETTNGFPCLIHCYGITNPDPEYSVRRVSSPIYIFEYILSGCGYIEIEGEKYKVEAGDAYLLPPYTKHHYYADKDNPYKKLWVNIISSSLDSILDALKIKGQIVFKQADVLDEFKKIMELERISYISENVSFLAFSYLMEAFSKLSMQKILKRKPFNDETARIVNYVDRCTNYKITSAKIAENLAISESKLISLFKKAMGITPGEYMRKERLNKAKKLLTTTDYSIEKISEILFYYDQFAFSNSFKKDVGMYPSEYRNNQKSTFSNSLVETL